MMWMRMPGETWPGAAASFLGAWLAMMVPMMLPTVAPALWRHHRSVAHGRGVTTAVVGAGYFFVWGVVGLAVHPLGVALASVEMSYAALARVAPMVVGVVVAGAGAWQFTRRKAHYLACCREAPTFSRPSVTAALKIANAWRDGLRLGLHCVRCCGNLMTIALVVGMMDLRVLALVGTAIAAERLAPAGERVARFIGVVAICAGATMIAA